MIVFSHSICHFVDIVVFMILLQLFYVLRTRNGSVMEEEIHLEGKFILQYEPCMHNCIMTRILEPYASLCIFLNKNLLVRNFPRGGEEYSAHMHTGGSSPRNVKATQKYQFSFIAARPVHRPSINRIIAGVMINRIAFGLTD